MNKTRRIAFFGGVKFPTASTTAKDDEGKLLPSQLQMGTGAYEVPLGVSFSMQTASRIGLVSDFFYNVNTRGNGGAGTDSFKYDLALGASIYPHQYRTLEEKVVNLYLELNGNHEVNVGDVLFLSPGVQFIARTNLLFELSLQAPVYQKFRGLRPEIDYTLGAGIRWLFPF